MAELPDLSMQNTTKVYQKGHKSQFFGEKITSWNSDAVFLFGLSGARVFKWKQSPISYLVILFDIHRLPNYKKTFFIYFT